VVEAHQLTFKIICPKQDLGIIISPSPPFSKANGHLAKRANKSPAPFLIESYSST
jgi:hypothetical protein